MNQRTHQTTARYKRKIIYIVYTFDQIKLKKNLQTKQFSPKVMNDFERKQDGSKYHEVDNNASYV